MSERTLHRTLINACFVLLVLVAPACSRPESPWRLPDGKLPEEWETLVVGGVDFVGKLDKSPLLVGEKGELRIVDHDSLGRDLSIPVDVDDLGRVSIRIGLIPGTYTLTSFSIKGMRAEWLILFPSFMVQQGLEMRIGAEFSVPQDARAVYIGEIRIELPGGNLTVTSELDSARKSFASDLGALGSPLIPSLAVLKESR